jgi:hypothetical protein
MIDQRILFVAFSNIIVYKNWAEIHQALRSLFSLLAEFLIVKVPDKN